MIRDSLGDAEFLIKWAFEEGVEGGGHTINDYFREVL